MTDTAATITDPRPNFTKAVSIARDVIGSVRPDQLDDATPCDEFTVRELVGHMIGAVQRIADAGVGRSPFDAPRLVAGLADHKWQAAFDAQAAAAEQVWSDDTVLTADLNLGFAVLPGFVSLMIYANELTVHTWDLARATGQRPNWDADVLEMAYGVMQQALPAEGRAERFAAAAASVPAGQPFDVPFRPAVVVADDAPMIDRLVAFNGRQPSALR